MTTSPVPPTGPVAEAISWNVVLGVPPADVEAPLNSAAIERLPEPLVVLSTSTTTPSVPADIVVGVESAAVPENGMDAETVVDVKP